MPSLRLVTTHRKRPLHPLRCPRGPYMPPRCIHCHGPHIANDTAYELRPKPNPPPKSKPQISAIKKISAEARLRYQAEAGCVKPSPEISNVTQQIISTPALDNLSSGSIPQIRQNFTTVAPHPGPSAQSSNNRFDILNVEGSQSEEQMQQ